MPQVVSKATNRRKILSRSFSIRAYSIACLQRFWKVFGHKNWRIKSKWSKERPLCPLQPYHPTSMLQMRSPISEHPSSMRLTHWSQWRVSPSPMRSGKVKQLGSSKALSGDSRSTKLHFRCVPTPTMSWFLSSISRHYGSHISLSPGLIRHRRADGHFICSW